MFASSPKNESRSPQPTSSIEPVETIALKPARSARLQSRIAVNSAPLWLRNATLPGNAMSCANVALSPISGFIRPRQFGPINRVAPPLQFRLDLFFERRTFRSFFLEARGDHNDRFCVCPNAFGDNAWYRACRCHHNNEVNGFRNCSDRRVTWKTKYFRAARIHGIDASLVSSRQQIFKNRPTHTPFAVRGSNHCDRCRRKEIAQRRTIAGSNCQESSSASLSSDARTINFF